MKNVKIVEFKRFINSSHNKLIRTKMNKIKVNGSLRDSNSIEITGLAKYRNKIPPFFIIEIDLDLIKERKKFT